ncbi:MAG: hypothetical protein ACK456_17500 [Pseudanabaenaceae cyanobacterium]|jgi:hypothetical protein
MSKLFKLVVCCLGLLPVSLLFSPKAVAQTVGTRECIRVLTPVSEIRRASLSPSPEGYILTVVEEDGVHTFGLTSDLNYYYSSRRIFRTEGAYPALIASDGSFRLALPVGAPSGCTYTGKLTFQPGAREKLFPRGDSGAACRSAVSLAEIKLRGVKNVFLWRSEKFRHNYSDYPDGRHSGYQFIIYGAGIGDVFRSRIFLTTISTDIISSCKDVGMVRFGEYQTDHFDIYGLLRNNKVVLFQCTTKKPISWGQDGCLYTTGGI